MAFEYRAGDASAIAPTDRHHNKAAVQATYFGPSIGRIYHRIMDVIKRNNHKLTKLQQVSPFRTMITRKYTETPCLLLFPATLTAEIGNKNI